MLIDINNANEKVVQKIMQTDGRWQYDDTNQPTTDQGDGTGGQAIATTGLTANQQDYEFAVSHLIVTRVEIQDGSGNWRKLRPFDEHDLVNSSLTDFMKTAGNPMYYDKKGDSLFLYPKPNYTQAASLKVYFKRAPIAFTSSDVSTGTKQPGFNSLYHMLIPLHVSYEYCADNEQTRKATLLMNEITKMEEDLENTYDIRGDDDPPRMTVVRRSTR